MFKCKLCHTKKEDKQMSTAHKNICRECHSATVRYRRLSMKQNVSQEDMSFKHDFEELCRYNSSIGAYVPNVYNNSTVSTLDRCPCCGMPNVQAYPALPNMCYDCGKMENNYRYTINQLRRGSKNDNTFVRRVAKVQSIEKVYLCRHRVGLKVPNIYLENRGPNGYTHFRQK